MLVYGMFPIFSIRKTLSTSEIIITTFARRLFVVIKNKQKFIMIIFEICIALFISEYYFELYVSLENINHYIL